MPTLASLANLSTEGTGPVPTDGFNMWPALCGDAGADVRREILLMGSTELRINVGDNGALISTIDGTVYKIILGGYDEQRVHVVVGAWGWCVLSVTDFSDRLISPPF
jgi:hypothetical protein